MLDQRDHVAHRDHVVRAACRAPRERQVYKEPQEVTVQQERREHRVTPARLVRQVSPDRVVLQVFLVVQEYSDPKDIRACQVIQATKGARGPKAAQALTERGAHPADMDKRVKGETQDPQDLKDHRDLLARGVTPETVDCLDLSESQVLMVRPEVMDHVD